jgi:uncharacterized protein YjbJ (UPF0337 family)
MNLDKRAGTWRLIRGQVKENWGKLTDDDLALIDGQYEHLIGRLQHRYGWRREQTENEIHAWLEADRLSA